MSGLMYTKLEVVAGHPAGKVLYTSGNKSLQLGWE